MRVSIAEAKARFAELVRRAEAGEVIELTWYGCPVARLTASEPPAGSALIGAMAGASRFRTGRTWMLKSPRCFDNARRDSACKVALGPARLAMGAFR